MALQRVRRLRACGREFLQALQAALQHIKQRLARVDRDLELHLASLCYRLRVTEQKTRAIEWGAG